MRYGLANVLHFICIFFYSILFSCSHCLLSRVNVCSRALIVGTEWLTTKWSDSIIRKTYVNNMNIYVIYVIHIFIHKFVC